MTIDEWLCRYELELFTARDLPDFAVLALEADFDSPSLRELAGSTSVYSHDLRLLFDKSLSELNLTRPSGNQAAMRLARDVATKVVTGAIGPYQGARTIWVDLYLRAPQARQLRVFIYLASEYEEDEKNRDKYLDQIIQTCRELLQEQE